MSMLKTCSLFPQNLGCVLYMSVSYTRDGTVDYLPTWLQNVLLRETAAVLQNLWNINLQGIWTEIALEARLAGRARPVREAGRQCMANEKARTPQGSTSPRRLVFFTCLFCAGFCVSTAERWIFPQHNSKAVQHISQVWCSVQRSMSSEEDCESPENYAPYTSFCQMDAQSIIYFWSTMRLASELEPLFANWAQVHFANLHLWSVWSRQGLWGPHVEVWAGSAEWRSTAWHSGQFCNWIQNLLQDGSFEAGVEKCRETAVKSDLDGDIRGAWLLTESVFSSSGISDVKSAFGRKFARTLGIQDQFSLSRARFSTHVSRLWEDRGTRIGSHRNSIQQQALQLTLLHPSPGRCEVRQWRGFWPCSFCRIDHWDNEREKIVILCDSSILFMNFDFITQKLKDFKRVLLQAVNEIDIGDFVYPEKSWMPWVFLLRPFVFQHAECEAYAACLLQSKYADRLPLLSS